MNTQVWLGILLPFLGTSLGAAMVFVLRDRISDGVQRALTGFAAGVMVAASFWSLLQPALDGAENMGRLSFLPAAIGFLLGIGFLLLLIPLGVGDEEVGNRNWIRFLGIGMDEETRKRVFDRFFQGDASHRGEGAGLGMTLAKRIVDILGGHISVSSAPGEGTTFTVTLPILQEEKS